MPPMMPAVFISIASLLAAFRATLQLHYLRMACHAKIPSPKRLADGTALIAPCSPA